MSNDIKKLLIGFTVGAGAMYFIHHFLLSDDKKKDGLGDKQELTHKMEYLRSDGWLTATEKRNIKFAYDYAIKNNVNAVQVNHMLVIFDYSKQMGTVTQNRGVWNDNGIKSGFYWGTKEKTEAYKKAREPYKKTSYNTAMKEYMQRRNPDAPYKYENGDWVYDDPSDSAENSGRLFDKKKVKTIKKRV